MDQAFELDIESRIRGGAESITQLERIESGFQEAKSALSDYEKELLGLEKALDKNRAAAESMRQKFADAVTAGDTKGITKYAQAYKDLEKEEEKLKKQRETAHDAMLKQQKVVQGSADKVGLLKKANADAEKGLQGYISKQVEGLSATEAATAAIGAEYAAALGLVAGLVAVTAALVKYTLEQTNARRNTYQTLRAITQSEDDAKALSKDFAEITRETGIGADQLEDWTKQLTLARRNAGMAGFEGEKLQKILHGAALANQALGDPSAAQHFIDNVNQGIWTVDQFGDRMEKQFGDVARQKMLGFDQQLGTLKHNISDLFSDEDIKGFQVGLSRIVSLFDRNTESGKALQSLLHTIFKPFGAGADDVAVVIERAFLLAELQVLKFGIYVKKHTKEISVAWEGAHTILKGIGVLLGVLAAGVVLLMTPMIVTTAAAVAGFMALTYAIGYVGDHIGDIGGWFKRTWEDVKGWADKIAHIGIDIINGITDFIAKGEQKIRDAMTKVMTAGVQAAKDAIGMHSPPKAYVEIAEAITGATSSTIDEGAGDVAAAVDRMMTPPPMPSSGGGERSGPSMSGNSFVYHGVKDAQHAKELTLASLTELLEDWDAQTGAEAVS